MSQCQPSDFTTVFAANHNNTLSFMSSRGRQWLGKQTSSIIAKEAEKYLNTYTDLIVLKCVFSNVTIKIEKWHHQQVRIS